MNHSMQPTTKQIKEWFEKSSQAKGINEMDMPAAHLARMAYAAGADAELEACVEVLSGQYEWDLLSESTGWKHFRAQVEDILRSARRPTPQQQAIDVCTTALAAGRLTPAEAAVIRTALEPKQ